MRFLPATILLLAILSLASGYALPLFDDADWRTVLFLTPYGIIENLSSENALSTFYFEPGRAHVVADISHRVAVAICYLGLVGLFFWQSRKLKGKRD